MKITLWTLNESYQALVKLAQAQFPASKHKLAYKLSRILKSAKSEMDALGESLTELQKKCGFIPGEEIKPEVLNEYNKQGKQFMQETSCELWGDPIKLEDLGEVTISAFDLALLDWLIIEEEEQTKTQAAQA